MASLICGTPLRAQVGVMTSKRGQVQVVASQSRIGKKPVPLGQGVTATVTTDLLKVKVSGPDQSTDPPSPPLSERDEQRVSRWPFLSIRLLSACR